MAAVDARSADAEEPVSSAAVDKATLLLQLDELLERYLNAVDAYQRAREQLTCSLVSGHLSLAQANYSNTSRTRYGRDYYDGRMQATTKITITGNEQGDSFKVVPSKPSHQQLDTTAKTAPEAQVTSSSAHDAAKDGSKESKLESEGADEAASETGGEKAGSVGRQSQNDPLRWFGILVPASLRSAQASFAAAVEGPVPRIATLASDLRRQEIEIGRLRKQIRRL